MEGLVQLTARLIQAGARAYGRKWSFLGLFALAFLASMIMLAKLDLLPDAPGAAPEAAAASPLVAAVAATPVSVRAAEVPMKVEIPSISLSAMIANPETTDIETLDQLLLHGAVRYPTSAKLGEEGNTILFGHSSYLPVVNNKAFKAFNEIQDLKNGDRITVYGTTTAYVYEVTQVAEADANSDALPLTQTGHTLTLATCDSFGKKTDRFVVVADLVESYPVAR